jgi:hypothetical protein
VETEDRSETGVRSVLLVGGEAMGRATKWIVVVVTALALSSAGAEWFDGGGGGGAGMTDAQRADLLARVHVSRAERAFARALEAFYAAVAPYYDADQAAVALHATIAPCAGAGLDAAVPGID